MEAKRIFVTGGAGFIGSAIVARLQQIGHEIVVYDNLSFGNRKFLNIKDENFIQGDILDLKLLQSSISKFSPHYVIHLAAIHFIPYCNQHPFEASNINIRGTANVLNACVDVSSLEKIFFASTAAVYPIYDLPIDESLLPAPSDIYGLSKYAGEELVKKFYLETKVPSIICRFFNAFGPNETNPHLIPEIQKQILNGHRVIKLGNTEPKRDFIHTTDMALAVEALLARFSSGVDTFNLGQGIEYSVMEVMLSFEEALGEKLTIEQDPARLRKSDRLHLVASIEKLKQFTGWQPTISLQKGIQTLLEE